MRRPLASAVPATTVLATTVLAVAALLAGCAAIGAPAAQRSSTPRARAAHEVPPATTPVETVPGPPPASPVDAIRAFVVPFINWSAADVVAHLRGLAARSVGAARSAMTLAAARAAGDRSLRRGGIANSGAIETIAPLAGRAGTFVVVTRERTTAIGTSAYAGLGPAWHVTLVGVTAVTGGGWVVSDWRPEV